MPALLRGIATHLFLNIYKQALYFLEMPALLSGIATSLLRTSEASFVL